MRMSNPDDQAYVSKVVSEHFSGLVGTLAQLRPGEAYAVGEAVPSTMLPPAEATSQSPVRGAAEYVEEHRAAGTGVDPAAPLL